jgi:hypothetical protein
MPLSSPHIADLTTKAAERSACADEGDEDVENTTGLTTLMTWTAKLWKKIQDDGGEVAEKPTD